MPSVTCTPSSRSDERTSPCWGESRPTYLTPPCARRFTGSGDAAAPESGRGEGRASLLPSGHVMTTIDRAVGTRQVYFPFPGARPATTVVPSVFTAAEVAWRSSARGAPV